MPVAVMAAATAAGEHKAETFHGVGRNELAYRLVSKMGWAEGQGLGKDNKGITKHLWTKKRTDSVGLGAEATNDWGAHSMQTNVYNSLLSKLDVIVNNDTDESSSSEEEGGKGEKKKAAKKKGKKKEKEGKKGGSKKGSGDSSDESEDEGDRKKAKAKAKKQAKKRKAESSDSSSSSDESDLEGKAASSSTDAHAARKAGRSYAAAAVMEQRYAYKRAFLKKTKDVKSYSSSDLSQILGFSVSSGDDSGAIAREAIAQHSRPGESPKKSPKKKKKKASGSGSDSDDEGSDSEPAKSKAPEPVVVRRPRAPNPPMTVLKGALSMMFENGGFLGSSLEDEKEQDWVFDEATQTKIAEDAHASKVQGKTGLGFGSDRPSKLGKDYEGSKKKFESDDESEGEGGEAEKKEKKKKKKEKEGKRKEREGEESSGEKKKKKKDKKAKRSESEGGESDAGEGEKQRKKDKAKKKLKHAKSFAEGMEPEEGEDKPKKKKLKRSNSV